MPLRASTNRTLPSLSQTAMSTFFHALVICPLVLVRCVFETLHLFLPGNGRSFSSVSLGCASRSLSCRMSLPILPHLSQKTRGTFGRNAKNTVNWHSVKLCGHLKNHRRSNAIVERGPCFCVLSHKKRYPSNCVISYVFRITSEEHVRYKKFRGHGTVHFLGTEKKGRDAHPYVSQPLTLLHLFL